ncbi:MAG TPA: hypothetical protein VF576_12305 [Rubricoccaceae bacterium]
MTPQTLRLATLALLGLGAVSTFALMVHANGSASDLLSDGAGVGFVLWALLPYAALALGLARFRSRRARAVGLAGALVVAACAVAVYVDTLFVHVDAQGALAFVFVPVLQLAVTLVVVGLAWAVEARVRGADAGR